MINNFLKLLSTGIVGLILFKHLETSATGEFFIDSSSFGSNKECPANNNSVCIKSYIHLVECFREITGNHENFSFAFFPNNKANSLYVAVTYTVHYSHNDSDDRIDYEDANSTLYIEEWVWSHTMVYIMFHPSLFKFLSIGYGKMSERTNSVRLTIPRLCHDNNDNHKLIERLTQMLHHFSVSVKWDNNKDDYRGRSFKLTDIERKVGTAVKMTVIIAYFLGYVVLRGVPYIMKHFDKMIEQNIKGKSRSFRMLSLIIVCNIHSLAILTSSGFSYNVYISGYNENKHTYFGDVLPYFYLTDPLFTILVLIFAFFNIKWKYHINKNEISVAIKKYVTTISFTLLATLYAVHSIFILFALIAEPLTVLSFGLFVTSMVAYSHMATNMVLLRMQRILKPHYTRTWLLTKQLFHGLKVVAYFIIVFALMIMIRWLMLEYLTAVEYRSALTSVSISGLVSIVTLSLRYSLKWSREGQGEYEATNGSYIEFKDDLEDDEHYNHQMAVRKLNFRSSKNFRFSNRFSGIELNSLSPDVEFVGLLEDEIEDV